MSISYQFTQELATPPSPVSERRARIARAITTHVRPPYGDSAVLASLLSRILDVEPSWVEFDGTIATHGGCSFHAKLDTFEGVYTLHLIGRCPHCGERGDGPAIGSRRDLERSVASFRRQFHTCYEMAP